MRRAEVRYNSFHEIRHLGASLLKLALLVVIFAISLTGQISCPGINLATTPRIVPAQKQSVFTIRQSDGSEWPRVAHHCGCEW